MGLINLIAPYRAYLLAALAALLVFSGWKVRDWQCKAAYASAIEKAVKANEKKQVVIDAASQDYEDKRGKSDAVTVERTNTIREVYRNIPAPPASCAAPDATRSVLEGSVRDANAAASGKSGSPVPASGNAS